MARPGGLRLLSGRRCVVALSGGADSAVAAHGATLHAASVRAVHVHHGLGGSDRLADAAREIAGVLGLDLAIVAVSVDGDSETAARLARRPALLGALEEGEWLVTGHTRDDLAETVLMRIIRGTGPAGLAAMSPEDGRILRPLLDRSRSEVRDRATEAGLPFVDDPENADPRHLRNRLRTRLLPALAEENPDIVGALARLAAHAVPTDHQVPIRVGGSVARIPVPVLAVTDPTAAAAALREAVAAIRPPHPPSTAEVDRLLAVATGDARRAELDGGLVALVDRTWLRVGPLPDPPAERSFELPMAWGGFTFSPWGPPGGLATALVPPGAVVRGAVAGDRIAIDGGHKDVTDAFAEAGVPPELRPAWPLVVDRDGGIAWIPLVRRAPGRTADRDRYLGAHARSEEAW